MNCWAVCSGAVTMSRSKVSVVTTTGAAAGFEGEEEEKVIWTPLASVRAMPTTRVAVLISTGLSFPEPGFEEEEISLATFSHRDWKPRSKVRAPRPYLLFCVFHFRC